MDHTETLLTTAIHVRNSNQNNNNRIASFQGGNEEEDKSQRASVLQQQWVTLTASMWPKPTAASAPRGGWRVPSDRLPVLAAVFCGAAFVVCLVFALIIYRCCIMPRKEKHFCSRMKEIPHNIPIASAYQQYPSHSAVYAEPQRSLNWAYSNRIVAPVPTRSSSPQWYQPTNTANLQCTHCPGICPPVPRSSSAPGPSKPIAQPIYATLAYGGGTAGSGGPNNTNTTRRQRPLSHPINYPVAYNGGRQVAMPEISEFSPHGTQGQYASSSILDEVAAKDDDGDESTLKTRSLPAWVRSKPRPLSTEDDLNDLYAKVNFSKKRKNRMRNDEAAIIALSKSQYLNKDTDTLVDNEAVIVYDERTAL